MPKFRVSIQEICTAYVKYNNSTVVEAETQEQAEAIVLGFYESQDGNGNPPFTLESKSWDMEVIDTFEPEFTVESEEQE